MCLMQPLFAQETEKNKIDELLLAYQKLNIFNGTALVAKHNEIIFDKGYGYSNFNDSIPNNNNTIFRIASVTKTFTATLILKLVELHKLSLTDKLSKFYPDFPESNKITIKDLLTHTSGVSDNSSADTVKTGGSDQSMMLIFKNRKLDFEPGTDWSYSNAGYIVLGFIIQKVTGITYEQAIRKYIFKPLKMYDSGFDFMNLSKKEKAMGYSMFTDSTKTSVLSSDDSSAVFAAGAIYSTVQDLYKWHKGLQEYKIVSKTLMEQAYIPFKKNYGYGWIIDSVHGKKMIYHSGNIEGFSSVFVSIPQDDICIILLNNKEGTDLETVSRKILDILYHHAYIVPVKETPIDLPDSILKKYVGTYEISNPHITAEILYNNGVLTAHVINGPSLELFPVNEKLFGFMQTPDAEIKFVTDKTGKATQFILYQNDEEKIAKKIK